MGLVFVALGLVVLCLYLSTLQRALERCAEESRAARPGSVWLIVIPLFGLVYHFVVVIRIARSLGNEFTRRGFENPEGDPGKVLGLLMCVLNTVAFFTMLIPVFGIVMAVAGIISWILYWIEIANHSGMIAAPFLPPALEASSAADGSAAALKSETAP